MPSIQETAADRRADRRGKLVATAARLFIEHGYDGTAVSDVVREIGVAQGTFYHYFRSKSDVLNAVVEEVNAALTERIRGILEAEGADPAAQVDRILAATLRMARDNEGLIAVIHREENVVLHNRLMQGLSAMLTLQLGKAVAAGKAAGRFDVPHAGEAAEAVVGAFLQLSHGTEAPSPQRSARVRATLDHLLRALLGVTDRFELAEPGEPAEGAKDD